MCPTMEYIVISYSHYRPFLRCAALARRMARVMGLCAPFCSASLLALRVDIDCAFLPASLRFASRAG
jgi:hypothetical protein